MELSMKVSVVLLSVMAGLMLGTQGCSEIEEYMGRWSNSSETDTQKLYYSDVVVYGKAGTRVKKGDFASKLDGIYTINFNVYCVYKGGKKVMSMNNGDVPETIFVQGFGNKNEEIPGCPPAKVNRDELVILYLKSTDKGNVFEIEYSPGRGDEGLLLDEISIHCDLDFVAKEEICEDYSPFIDEDCIKYEKPVPPPVPETTAKSTTGNKQSTMAVEVNDDDSDTNQKGTKYDTHTDGDDTGNPGKSVGDGNGATSVCISSIFLLVSTLIASLV